MIDQLDILGVHVNRVNLKEALKTAEGYLQGDSCKMIVTPNSEIVMNAVNNNAFLKLINSSDMVIPDGIGLVYASKIIGKPLSERVTGIDFLESMLCLLNDKGQSIFLLGSKPGIADKAAERMKKKYPNLIIAGTYHGYFNNIEEKQIIEKINTVSPDVLCVALGSPKQEKFIHKYKESLNTKIAVGVGGSLDVWAGELKRAPDFFKNNGLEWLYRFIQQPSRYKRMMAIPKFILYVSLKGK